MVKRFLVVFCVAGFLAVLPLSHLVLAGKPAPERIWCHARDAAIAPESWQTDLQDASPGNTKPSTEDSYLAHTGSPQASSMDAAANEL